MRSHIDHRSDPATRAAWLERRIAMEALSGRHTVLGFREESIECVLFRVFDRMLNRVSPVFRGGHRNAAAVQMVEVRLEFPDLPAAFDGYTILHLSDFHTGNHPAAAKRVAELVAGVEVDLVALTGDFQSFGRPMPLPVDSLAATLAGIRARDGVLGILGNHDRSAILAVLEGLGIRMLINEHFIAARGDDRLVFTGTDDVHRFFTEAAPRALATAPDGFRIALVHSPDLADHAERAGSRLFLCGHTHGGQICLPGGKVVMTGLDRHRELAAGAWRHGRMQGYTSRGVGVGGPAVRYNCRGEVVRLVLTRR
jgi:predicted MPP superfamily phosphohydrolase